MKLPTQIGPLRSGTQLHKFFTLKQKEFENKLTDKGQPWGGENPSDAYANRAEFKKLCYEFEIISIFLESEERLSTSRLFDIVDDRMKLKYGQPLDVSIFAYVCNQVLQKIKGTVARPVRPLMPPSPANQNA